MMKKKNTLKRIIAIALVSCVVALPSVTGYAAEIDSLNASASSSTIDTSSADNQTMSNDYLQLRVNGLEGDSDATGRFTLWTTGGDPNSTTDDDKRLIYGTSPGTSYSTFVVDGEVYIFGENGLSEGPTFDAANSQCTAKQVIGDIEVTQILSFVNNSATGRDDVLEIQYVVKNAGSASHTVGSRIMIDTMLGDNDDAPFRVEGTGNVTTETEYSGNDIPQYWQAFDDLTNPTVVSQGTFIKSGMTKPDKVQFCNWSRARSTAWDLSLNEGDSNGDSAVNVIWNEKALAAGGTRTYKTYYGLSEVTNAQVASLAFSVYTDGTASISNSAYAPHAVTAYLKDTGDAAVENAYARIVLPEGWTLSSGSATRTYTTIAPSAEKQVDWKIKIPASTPEGDYTVKIICGADNIGEKTITKTIRVPGIAFSDPLVNKSKVNSSEYTLGESVQITGAASGGQAPYTYAYYFKKAASEDWTLKGTRYGSDTSMSFKPSSAESYNVKINVKDSTGAIVSKTFTVKVADAAALDNKSTVASSAVTLGNTIDIKGAAVGGKGPYTYTYYFKQADADSWTVKGTANTTATDVSIKPSVAKDYNIKVNVKDSTGKVVSKTFIVRVSSTNPLDNKSTVKKTQIYLGDTIDVKGAAEGGKGPYTYSYYFKQSSAEGWTLKGTANTTDTAVSITPSVATDYQVKVNAKDANGLVVSKIFNITVKKALDNQSTVNAASISLGETISIKGAASGGEGGYTYTYYFKRSADEGWTRKGDAYTDTTSASVKPSAAGKYDIKVNVKDSSGVIVSKVFTVNVVNAVPLDNKSTIEAETINLGGTIDIKAAAEGGTGPYTYTYYFKQAASEGWTRKDVAETETSVSIKPSVATDYNIKVVAKDSAGKASEKEFTVKVNKADAPLDNQSTINSSKITLGDLIEIKGVAEGGTGDYKYAYYFKQSANSTWNLKGVEYGTDTEMTVKPTVKTNYDIMVKIKDSSGKIVCVNYTVTVI